MPAGNGGGGGGGGGALRERAGLISYLRIITRIMLRTPPSTFSTSGYPGDLGWAGRAEGISFWKQGRNEEGM